MEDHFTKLPKAWQNCINKAIKTVIGTELPDIAEAYREMRAKHLLECLLAKRLSQADVDDFSESLVDFLEGWKAAMDRFTKDHRAAVASWVREYGEFTEFCPDEGLSYPAFIVKESDLSV